MTAPSRGPLSGKSADGTLAVEVRLDPPSPRVGELFTAHTRLTELRRGGRIVPSDLLLDATMPAHGHGMTTLPRHTREEDGAWLTRGLKLHMPGEWRFEVRVVLDDREDSIHLPFLLRPASRP